jgi:FolB domain-containing protein
MNEKSANPARNECVSLDAVLRAEGHDLFPYFVSGVECSRVRVPSALRVSFEGQAKRGRRKVWSTIWANTTTAAMQDPFASDAILINRLHAQTVVGSDCWGKMRPQPLVVSVRLSASLQRAAETDDIQHTVNYGTLYKSIASELGGLLDEKDVTCTLADIANGIVERCIMPLITQPETSDSEPNLTIRIEIPKALLSGGLWGYEIQTQGLDQHHSKYFVKDLCISVIIGVNPPERHSKQVVELDIEFYGDVQPDIVDYLVKVRTPLIF